MAKRKRSARSGNFITGREDMQWLRDVHLPKLSLKKFKSAMIYGNSDCPEKVALYRSANPGVKASPVVFKRKGSGCRLKKR